MMRLLQLLTIILTMILVAGCNENNNADQTSVVKTVPVEVAEVKKGDFEVEGFSASLLMPSKQTPVMLEAPAEVSELFVQNGEKVEKDEKIAAMKTPLGTQNLYAPQAGQIAHLEATEGSFQTNEEPFLLIVDLDKLHVTFDLTNENREHFEKDDSVTLIIEDKEYKGTVLNVDVLPGETGLYPIIIELENKAGAIIPGTAAKLLIIDERVQDTWIVPTEAIISNAEERFLFIVKDNKAKKVPVVVEETQSDQTAVDAVLESGDKVIVKGQSTLTDGAKVEVKDGDNK